MAGHSVDQRSHDYLRNVGTPTPREAGSTTPVDHELLQPLLLTVWCRNGCSVTWAASRQTKHNPDSNTSSCNPPDFQDGIPHRTKTHHAGQGISSVGYGRISSEWQYKEDGRISYTATVPANTTATLYLPLMEKTDNITESGKRPERSRRRGLQRHSRRKGRDRTAIGHLPVRHGKGKPRPCGRKYVPKLTHTSTPSVSGLHLSCSEDIRYASVTACNGQIPLYRPAPWWEHRHVYLGTRHLRGEGGSRQNTTTPKRLSRNKMTTEKKSTSL